MFAYFYVQLVAEISGGGGWITNIYFEQLQGYIQHKLVQHTQIQLIINIQTWSIIRNKQNGLAVTYQNFYRCLPDLLVEL